MNSSEAKMSNDSQWRGNETILLAEDEELVRKLLGRTLRQYGYAVLEAKNGVEALVVYGQSTMTIDLIVTDISMPQMSGMDLVDRLRTLRPELKIICISGFVRESASMESYLKKGILFLQKPLIPHAFVKSVRQLLDGDVQKKGSSFQ